MQCLLQWEALNIHIARGSQVLWEKNPICWGKITLAIIWRMDGRGWVRVKATRLVQVREDVGLNSGNSTGGGVKWTDLGYRLKAHPRGADNGFCRESTIVVFLLTSFPPHCSSCCSPNIPGML